MAHIDIDIAPSEENGLDMEAIELAQRAMVENAGLSMELIDSWNLNPLEPLVCATAWHSMAHDDGKMATRRVMRCQQCKQCKQRKHIRNDRSVRLDKARWLGNKKMVAMSHM